VKNTPLPAHDEGPINSRGSDDFPEEQPINPRAESRMSGRDS